MKVGRKVEVKATTLNVTLIQYVNQKSRPLSARRSQGQVAGTRGLERNGRTNMVRAAHLEPPNAGPRFRLIM